jgi:hypothetical protein
VTQQGRVVSDADLNEQLEIGKHRTEISAIDIIGQTGAPATLDGFRIGKTPDGQDLVISPGRFYVDGLLCELDADPVRIDFPSGSADSEAAVAELLLNGRILDAGQWVVITASGIPRKVARIVDVDLPTKLLTFDRPVAEFRTATNAVLRRVETYTTQRDYPEPEFTIPSLSPPGFTSMDLDDGVHIAYLLAFQREVNAIDDPHIRETALGGPDTAARVQTVWQVRLVKVTPPDGKPSCKAAFPEWNNATASTTGTLNARTQASVDPKNPCILPPTAGFRRLENQLYRVQIHQSGDLSSATFKWSRENASVETGVKVNGNVMLVDDPGKDNVLGFAGNQWVEIVDDESALNFTPRSLVQIDRILPSTREITAKQTISAFSGRTGLKLRRWDQREAAAGPSGIPMQNGWVDLEDGVQIRFSPGHYESGDYWLIPARTGTGEIEWPPFRVPNTDPIPQPPAGVRRHFSRLALLRVAGGNVVDIEDCRKLFPALTEIAAFDTTFVSQVFRRGLYNQEIGIKNGDTVMSADLARGIRVQLTRDVDPSTVAAAGCSVALELPDVSADEVPGAQQLIVTAGVSADGTDSIAWTPSPAAQRYLANRLSLDGSATITRDWDVPVSKQWRLARGAAIATYQPGSDPTPPTAVNNQRLGGDVAGLSMGMDLSGGFTSNPSSAALIFNYVNSGNFWEFRFIVGMVPSGTGSFSDITGLELTQFVNGRAINPGKVFLPGANTPARVEFEIVESSSGPLRFRFAFTMPGRPYPQIVEPTFLSMPTSFVASSRVGMSSRWSGPVTFRTLNVRSGKGESLALLPPKIPARLTVTRGFLRFVDGGSNNPGPDFSTWFWVQPTQGAYGYPYGALAIGLNLL